MLEIGGLCPFTIIRKSFTEKLTDGLGLIERKMNGWLPVKRRNPERCPPGPAWFLRPARLIDFAPTLALSPADKSCGLHHLLDLTNRHLVKIPLQSMHQCGRADCGLRAD